MTVEIKTNTLSDSKRVKGNLIYSFLKNCISLNFQLFLPFK